MKKRAFIFLLPLFILGACSKTEISEQTGYLLLNVSGTNLKAGIELSDFTLHISNNDGVSITHRMGDVSGQIALAAGMYTFEVYSGVFSEPKFETPNYRGVKDIAIVDGETTEASIVCSQNNAGIKIVWSDEFAALYQTYQVEARCDQGYLVYSASEDRTGYFLPGNVTLKVSADGKILNGGTITLVAKDMVTATLRPKESPTGTISIGITVDELVNEREIEIIIDPEEEVIEPIGNSETNPYSVADAIAKQGQNAVWVTGYIVGAKPSAGYDFVNPGTWIASNIVLADDIAETSDTKCIFVELGSSGTYRNNLNLLDHPGNLHQKVMIKGNLLNYQSRAGLRNLTSYSFK